MLGGSSTQRSTCSTAKAPTLAVQSWATAPVHPLLVEDDVHVWRADLEAVSDDLLGLLCAEERARAGRIRRERKRQVWGRAHGLLRALLGRYLRMDPRTLRFSTGAHGKPALLEDARGPIAAARSMPPRAPQLSFNLSHSGQLALYAFTATGAVGVDVELARRSIDEVAIAARTFGPAEARRLEGLEPAMREQEFLRAWVRTEAALKWQGTGLGAGNAQVSGREPWIAELDVGPRAAAAVALEHRPRELRCWDWQAQPSGAGD